MPIYFFNRTNDTNTTVPTEIANPATYLPLVVFSLITISAILVLYLRHLRLAATEEAAGDGVINESTLLTDRELHPITQRFNA